MQASLLDTLTDQVERHRQSLQEKLREQGLALPPDDAFLDELGRVWEGSDYVAQSCLRHPALLPELAADGTLRRAYAPGEMLRRLQDALGEVADEPALVRALRCFRRAQMVRIIWRDLARLAPLAETLEDLSALADACVEAALARLYDWQCRDSGVPRDELGEQQRLVVLGMGKLGARELNLSSDIDLIFAFPSHGEVEGARHLSNEQFFIRLCQRLMRVLDAPDGEGFVFRVDARLRPFGDAGPLAMSFAALEDYYQTQAREWERYAMIKARVVAGDQAAGERLMAMLRPFVYRRYLDFGVIESLRDMKQLISQELKRKGMADNVKLGPGGIREVEFIGQAFQLVRGGRVPDLQIRPILPVLHTLGRMNLLPAYVVRELTAAYEFLRLVENRLQAWQDRQTHSLPEDELGRLRLARAMGYADWTGFHAELERHRRRVQAQFDQVFAAPQAEAESQPAPLLALWQDKLEEADACEVLVGAGYRQPAETLERLRQLRDSHACRALGARGGQRLEQLMPLLLEAVGNTDEPDRVLERLMPLLEAIARRTAYIALLVERPLALSQLVRLSAQSLWITQRLTRYPLLLDELLDPRRLYAPLKRGELEAELDTLLERLAPDDLEQQMDRLRQFAHSNMLRVAAADITGAIPLMVVSDYLTEIAEVACQRVLDLAWAHLVASHGRPTGVLGEDTGFVVIGYGKLGGIELGYGSDLDLVFLHGSGDANAATDGARPLGNEVFYSRLGQRMIHIFTTRTPAGQLYDADMRLRPNGNSGLLVSPLAAFEDYQKNSAWTWEHQALLRARPVAGDRAVAERFQRIRREVLARERDGEKLRAEVCEMREKMRVSLDKSDAARFDPKQGRGGIADIEFMVQYAALRWAHRYPDLLDWTDNIRLLETLSRHCLLEGDTGPRLADAYRTLRAACHRKNLQAEPALIPADALLEERRTVSAAWDSLMGS